MLTILKLLPRAGAVVLANGLRKMPGIKSDEVQEWLKSFKLEGDQDLIAAAVSFGRPDMAHVNALLACQNIAVNMKDDTGWTVLMRATEGGRTEVVKALLAAGADVNAQNNCGETALSWASGRGRTEIVRALLAAGAKVNMQNNHGQTALFLATVTGHAEVVKELLAAGADVNLLSVNGNTALLWAIEHGHPEIARALLTAGADVDMKNNKGYTALTLARNNARSNPGQANEYNAVIKLLEDAEKAQKEKAARK